MALNSNSRIVEKLLNDLGVSVRNNHRDNNSKHTEPHVNEALESELLSIECVDLAHKALRPAHIEILSEFLCKCKRLKTIKLGFNALGDDGATIISEAMKHNQSVTCLDMGFNGIGDRGALVLADMLSRNRVLRTLYLSGNVITPLGFTHLASSLSINGSLSVLHLAGNSCMAEGAARLAKALSKSEVSCSNLESLYLGANKLGFLGANAFFTALGDIASLRKLFLGDNKIGDGGCLALTSFLIRYRNMQVLELSFNLIGSTGMEALAGSLTGYRSLLILKLDNNQLGDGGAQILAAVVSSLCSLEELYVGFNEMGAVGVAHIVEAIREEPGSLQRLMLSGNHIGAEGARVVATMLAQNTILRTLYLDHTRMGTMGERQVAAGIATNRSSALMCITGFELGQVLTQLGSPVSVSNLNNDQSLAYLRQIWTQHMDSQAHPSTDSLENHQRTQDPRVSDMSKTNVSDTTVFCRKSERGPLAEAADTSKPYGALHQHQLSSSSSNECTSGLLLPDFPKLSTSEGSSPLRDDYIHAPNRSNTDPSSPHTAATAAKYRTDTSDHSFQNISTDFSAKAEIATQATSSVGGRGQLTGLSLSKDSARLSASAGSKSLAVSPSRMSESRDRRSFESDFTHSSVANGSIHIEEIISSPNTITFKSSGTPALPVVTLDDPALHQLPGVPTTLLSILKAIAQLPFSPAELWKLHQFYFSPPEPGTFSHDILTRQGDQEETGLRISIDQGNDSESEEDAEVKRLFSVPCDTVISLNGKQTGVYCGRDSTILARRRNSSELGISSSSRNKRPSNRLTMERIAAYPRLKFRIKQLQANREETSMLTLLRQLQYLESQWNALRLQQEAQGLSPYIVDFESLLLDTI